MTATFLKSQTKRYRRGVPAADGKSKRTCIHCRRIATVRSVWQLPSGMRIPVRYCDQHLPQALGGPAA